MREPRGRQGGGRGGGKGKGDDVADGGGGKGHGGRGVGGRGGGCTTIEYHFNQRGWWSNYVPENCPGTENLDRIVDLISREFRRQVMQIPLVQPDPGRDEERGAEIKEIFSNARYVPDWFNSDNLLYNNGKFLDIENVGNVRALFNEVEPLLSTDGVSEYNKHYHFHEPPHGQNEILKNCVTLTIRFVVRPRTRMAAERLDW